MDWFIVNIDGQGYLVRAYYDWHAIQKVVAEWKPFGEYKVNVFCI